MSEFETADINIPRSEFDDLTYQAFYRVYYEDTDFSGRVYHANYLKYCERGRSDFLKAIHIHHSELAELEKPIYFIVRHMDIDFLGAAKIDDVMKVTTDLVVLKGARFILEQNIYVDEQHVFKAMVTCATIDDRGKPCRLDLLNREKLEHYLQPKTD